MEHVFITILNMSFTASIAIAAVAVFRLFLKRAPKIYSYLLWGVVLFRLLCPFSFSSALSLFEVLHAPSVEEGRMAYIPDGVGLMEQPEITVPVPAMEDMANVSLPSAALGDSVNPMQILLFAGGCIWVSGMIVMLFYHLFAYWRLKRRLKEAVWEEGNVYRVETMDIPFVCGILSPVIYLPCGLSENEKRYILRHEQNHIRRGDHIWRTIGWLALCLHWFNPFVWLAFFLSGKDMEMSCDEAVIRQLGNGVKKEYSASLLSFASGRRIVPGMPLAFGEGETGSRIKNILRYKTPARIVGCMAVIVCIVVTVVLASNPRDGGEMQSEGEGLEVYYYPDEKEGQERTLLESKAPEENIGQKENKEPEENKEQENGQMDEITYLQIGEEVQNLSATALAEGTLADGVYRVYANSLSYSARGIDRYLAEEMDSRTAPFLAFAQDCQFSVNQEMDRLAYGEVSFETFAALAEEMFSYLNPPVLLTFKDGVIVYAVLEAYYGSGISYEDIYPDTWYADVQGITGLSGEKMLTAYYTLAGTHQLDIGYGAGEEEILVYTGNIGDGESGIVLFLDAEGEILNTLSAHASRAGWNNIYLGERNGEAFIMTVQIEDRDTYGEYGYHVFRLAPDGSARQIAGSSFYFHDGVVPYDDGLFAEWAGNLSGYLEDSYLLLSTQEGEIRTTAVSEADKYNYETLKR